MKSDGKEVKTNKIMKMWKQTKETEGKSGGLCFICLLIISLVHFLLYLDAYLILFIWDSIKKMNKKEDGVKWKESRGKREEEDV